MAASVASNVGVGSGADKDAEIVQLILAPSGRHFVNPYPEYEKVNADDEENQNEVIPAVVPKDTADMDADILYYVRYTLGVSRDANVDGGIYTGAAGIAYMLIHIHRSGNTNINLIERAINNGIVQSNLLAQISFYQLLSPTKAKLGYSGFLIGRVGVDAVAGVFFEMLDKFDATMKHLKQFAAAAEYYVSPDYSGSEELLVGRAGYLCACLWLQEMVGTCPVSKQGLAAIWLGLVESGLQYSSATKSPCPLMYSYQDTEYLGAVHGLCSILQILLSFPTFCAEYPEYEKVIHDSVDYFLTIQFPSGNFPPEMEDVRNGFLLPEDELVHFCHGAPGVIYMLGKAYLRYKDDKYLEACVKCSNVIWQNGLLQKGPGLCHGVSGNAYAFLLLYRLTQDPSYLYKAKKFRDFMFLEQFEKRTRTPDCPYSLFEGSAGVVCFLVDLQNPDKASFPFFNIFYNYAPPSGTLKSKLLAEAAAKAQAEQQL